MVSRGTSRNRDQTSELPITNMPAGGSERSASTEGYSRLPNGRKRHPIPSIFCLTDSGLNLDLQLWNERIMSLSAPHILRSLSSALQISSGPVSYTHLRAHETKANLVCRLLLEKKKRILS